MYKLGTPAKGLNRMCWPTGPSCRMEGTRISCDLIKSLMNLHCVLHFPAHWPPRGGGKMDRVLVKSFLPLPRGQGHRPVTSGGAEEVGSLLSFLSVAGGE